MNKLLAALITTAFATTGAFAVEAKKVELANPAAPAASAAATKDAKVQAKKEVKVEAKKEEAKK